ncbi:ATPase, T2SS/T4P/T4SS family [Brevibacillus sp. NPDC058079]|uniref:ATPase, T2SS/T4P/T4SS family n=1 Tax=Brevibacillus sp. NPDC058079 TaxID=3346330 RepID=UPI0036EAFED4
MNYKFSSNPIVVKHKNKNVGVIELDLDHTAKEFVLEISDEKNELLFKGEVDEQTFLSVDSSSGSITLLYVDPNDKSVIFRRRVDLMRAFNLSDSEKEKSIKSLSEEALYEKISTLVKELMDNPKGSPKETQYHTLMMNKATMDKDARSYVENKIRHIVAQNADLSDSQVEGFTHRIYANFYGMGILQEIDDDPEVGEIMVNGYTYPSFRCDIYYVKNGEKIMYEKTFKNFGDMYNVFSRSIAFSKKELNNVENAIIEATRANRDRVNIIIPDASESYVMNIRKFGNFVPDLENMKKFGTIDEYLDRLFMVLVKGKANIGIGGEMGTGKTTLINYLLTYTKPDERKVVIASVSETDVDRVLKGHDVVMLNVDDEKNFTFPRHIRASLRTTASRIIVPETRGNEFKQVYEANGKTAGNMFTAHALDDYAFLDMCVDMYVGDGSGFDLDHLKNKLAKTIPIIVIMRKVGTRIRIDSVSEVVLDDNRNFDKMNVLYYWHQDPEDATKGEYRRTDNRISNRLKALLNKYGVPMTQMEHL